MKITDEILQSMIPVLHPLAHLLRTEFDATEIEINAEQQCQEKPAQAVEDNSKLTLNLNGVRIVISIN
jgi:hypothetical protein